MELKIFYHVSRTRYKVCRRNEILRNVGVFTACLYMWNDNVM